MRKHKTAVKIAYLCIILILVLVMIYSGLQILESTVFNKPEQEDAHSSKTIVRDGVSYFPRQDITVVMVLGIDRFGVVEDSGYHRNSGSADMVALMIFDDAEEVCNILYLNRDTMLTMPVLGIGGKQAGTYHGQLALAHTYGSGLEDSCENVKNTLETFLHGLTIDYYVSMNMDAISMLTDAVGGVTVMVEDDFSLVDPTIPMGKVTLTGEQAITFVRSRKDVGTQLNLSRMERQKQFLHGFVDSLRVKLNESDTEGLKIYESVSAYIVSDCSWNVLDRLLENYSDYDIQEIYTLPGENVLGKVYYEYHVDAEKMDELVVDLFYTPIK